MPRCKAPKARNPPTRVGRQGIRKPRRCEEGAEEPTPENVGKSPVYLPETGRYRCRFCAETFGDARNGKRHQLTHGNERKYLCTVCDRGFSRPDLMNNHFNKCFHRCEGRPPRPEEMPRQYRRAAAAQSDEMAQPIEPNQAVQPTQPDGAEQASFNCLLDMNHLANVNGSYQWPIDGHNPNNGHHPGVQAAERVINTELASTEPFMFIQGQTFDAAFSGAQGQPIFGPSGPTSGAQPPFFAPTSTTSSPTSSGPTFSNSGTPFISMSPQPRFSFPTTEGPQQAPVLNLQYQHAEPHQAPQGLETSMCSAFPEQVSWNASGAATDNQQPTEPEYVSPGHAAGYPFHGRGFYQYAAEVAAVNGQPNNGGNAAMQNASAFLDISRQQGGVPMNMNAPASDNTLRAALPYADLFSLDTDLNNDDFGTGHDLMDHVSDFAPWLKSLGLLPPENQS